MASTSQTSSWLRRLLLLSIAFVVPALLTGGCPTTTTKEPPKDTPTPTGPVCKDNEVNPTDLPQSADDCTRACNKDQPGCDCVGMQTGLPTTCKCMCKPKPATPPPDPDCPGCCTKDAQCGEDISGLDEKGKPFVIERRCLDPSKLKGGLKGFVCNDPCRPAPGKNCGVMACCRRTGPPKHAQTWGDPHLRTLDGLGYDFQAVGEFVLASDGNGFDIQVRQAALPGSKVVATNAAVAMRIAGDRVAIYANQSPPLRVGGTATTITGGVLSLPGGGVIYSDDNRQFDVRWPSANALQVNIAGDHVDLDLEIYETPAGLRGLLGNADGDLANDLQDRAGTLIAQPPVFSDLYGVFAPSWRVSQEESLFDYGPGEDTNTFTDLSFPSAPVTVAALTPAELEKATATCTAKGIADAWLRDACLLDVALTGDPIYADGAATATPPMGGIGTLARYDFEGEVGPEWSSKQTSTTPGAKRPKTRFLGEFSADAITLTLDDLPAHTSVTVVFDLYVIRSWDGNATSFGPDIWELSVDGGPTLLHTTFSTFSNGTQAYPDMHPEGSHPGNEGAEVNSLGYTFQGPQDAIYRLRYTFPHTAGTLVLKFAGVGLQGAADESWGLDNVEIGAM